MDISEIRRLSEADLEAALVDARQELWKVRFDLATRQEPFNERVHHQAESLLGGPLDRAARSQVTDGHRHRLH